MKTDERIAAYLAGAMDENARAEFETDALADAELRRQLLEQRCMSTGLHALLGDSSDLENGILSALTAPPVEQSVARVVADTVHAPARGKVVPMPVQTWVHWPLAVAAAIAVAMLLAAMWPSRDTKENHVALPSADAAAKTPRAGIGGTTPMNFANGARVNVFDSARVESIGPSSARLVSGRLTASVPFDARGFAIETPAGRVVDLGTRFGVATGAGDSADSVEVQVFEGRVEVITRQQQHVQLVAGEAAVLDPARGVIARTPADEAKFSAPVQVAGTAVHLENPFVGATFYRNVDYVAAVNAAADLQGGALAKQMRQVANFPTFLWLDSIAAVNGTNGYPRSLTAHLDQALAQGANAIGIVIYNLPNRDGAALASNGELLIAQNGLQRYKTEYIDAIFNIISQPKYAGLRIVMVIEPDSLPNLINNVNFPKVAEAKATGAYVQGVQYAIGTLRALGNTYAYIDVAHAGWLGWPNNFRPFVELLKQVGAGIAGGCGKVDGFISNTANYNVFTEPFMTANQNIGGQPVRSLQGIYDWNDFIDEQSYATALRAALITGNNAYPASVGLLLDTSRNGWGGPNRPTGPSTSTKLGEFVRATTLDKRTHKGNWGNQSGAGIGARPAANPAPGYHAFVWVKPPGDSDGSSTLIPTGPENPTGKGFDRMCDPTYHGNSLNGNSITGALPNAPVAGRWFQAQFTELVRNAFPPFQP